MRMISSSFGLGIESSQLAESCQRPGIFFKLKVLLTQASEVVR